MNLSFDVEAVLGNARLERQQLLEAAMHVPDGIDGSGPGVEGEACARHIGS